MKRKFCKIILSVLAASTGPSLLLSASCSLKKIEITFTCDGNGHIVSGEQTIKVASGTKFKKVLKPKVAPNDPDNYEFDDWYINDWIALKEYPNYPITENTKKIEAKFNPISKVTLSFSVENGYFPGGDPEPISIKKGTLWRDVDKPEVKPTVEGKYEFMGWFDGDTKLKDTTEMNETTTVKAIFKTIHSTITFKTDGFGKFVDDPSQSEIQLTVDTGVTFGEIDDVPEVEEGDKSYTFDGWYIGDTEVTSDTVIESDMEIIAKFTPSFAYDYDEENSTAILKALKSDTLLEVNNIPNKTYKNGKEYTVASIGSNAFAKSKIKSVNIPLSVISIGDSAFSGCKELGNFSYEGSIKQWRNVAKGADWHKDVSKTNQIVCNDGPCPLDAFEAIITIETDSHSHIDDGTQTITIYEKTKWSDIRRQISGFEVTDSSFELYGWFAGDVMLSDDDYFESSTTITAKCIEKLPYSLYEWEFDFENKSATILLYKGEEVDTLSFPAQITIGDDDYIVKQLGSKQSSKIFPIKSPQIINIPSCVEIIEEYAFGQNLELKIIHFEDNSKLKYIYHSAFSAELELVKMNLPSTIETIEMNAFSTEPKWEYDLSFGANLLTLGANSFSRCYKIKSLTFDLNSKITEIPQSCFSEIGSQSKTSFSVELPNAIQKIGIRAFDKANIFEIVLPKSLIEIGEGAFQYCENLTTIIFNGTKSEWASITKGQNWHANVKVENVQCSDGPAPIDS